MCLQLVFRKKGCLEILAAWGVSQKLKFVTKVVLLSLVNNLILQCRLSLRVIPNINKGIQLGTEGPQELRLPALISFIIASRFGGFYFYTSKLVFLNRFPIPGNRHHSLRQERNGFLLCSNCAKLVAGWVLVMQQPRSSYKLKKQKASSTVSNFFGLPGTKWTQ